MFCGLAGLRDATRCLLLLQLQIELRQLASGPMLLLESGILHTRTLRSTNLDPLFFECSLGKQAVWPGGIGHTSRCAAESAAVWPSSVHSDLWGDPLTEAPHVLLAEENDGRNLHRL